MFAPTLLKLAETALAEARAKGLHIVTAESCTGGLVAGVLTEIAGSSDVFERGFVTYSNKAKEEALGVPAATIHTHGAVSEPVAVAMAAGAAKLTGADVAVGVTGIAGPDGGSDAKPVGTVWFGFSVRGATDGQRVIFPGSRADIRGRAAQFALHGMLRRVVALP